MTIAQLNLIVQKINTIENETYKDTALAEIVLLYIRGGQFKQAAQLTETLWDNDWLLPKIIAEYAQNGQINQSKALTKLINESWQNQALIEITTGYARMGDFDAAVEFANTINSSDIKYSALMAVGKQYAESEDYRQSLELFQNIAANTANETISYDIESYFIPLVNCAISHMSNKRAEITIKNFGAIQSNKFNRVSPFTFLLLFPVSNYVIT